MKKHFLSIDIGGTNVKYALIDQQGQLLQKKTVATVKSNLADFVRQIQQIIDDLAGNYQGIAISVPGKVIHPSDQIIGGGFLSFLDQQNFNELLRIPNNTTLSVENDGKAAALAEMWLGNLRDVQNGAAIVLGSGIGCGLILNKQLYYGTNFQAGEVSFMLKNNTFDMQNLAGTSGSAVSMIEQAAQLLELVDLTDGQQVFAAINQDDPRVMAVFEEFCQNIAILIYNIQTVVDVQRFVIGGGISAQLIVSTMIRQKYQDLRQNFPFLEKTFVMPEIMAGKFHNDANLYGALYQLLQIR
ncbi:ROK family protein [Bombilactobacillus folatiphilus]|uniref:ROK family protein n=1 Tax=Bombilactobacillus folatiphilus TaxID=2923362 RepID=A0ABY4P6Z2_9LACO|nr:ROK family protein [Bombilactobacillus folatiphilus]UQS81485.1 ROK family protein [Bombilactobacillus folatiphilus]